MPLISIVSGMISSEVVKVLTGIQSCSVMGRLLAYDFSNGKISEIEYWEKQSNCRVCGKR